jgi:hypothetical protein
MTDLTLRKKGLYSGKSEYYDPVLVAGAITINDDAYGSFDYIYDVKGILDALILIENTGGANGLTYVVEGTRKEFTALSELVGADFTEVVVTEANVAFGAEAKTDWNRDSGEITALRLRVKRQTAGQNTTLAGNIVIRA